MSDMRICRFLSMGIAITIIAVVYVHQRIEIVKMGYTVQKNRSHLDSLVDHNSRLMYNLSKLESPKNLLRSLGDKEIRFASKRIGFQESYQIAQMDIAAGEVRDGLIGRILDIFSPNAEARPRK